MYINFQLIWGVVFWVISSVESIKIGHSQFTIGLTINKIIMFLKHITTKAVTNKNKNSVASVHTTD